MNEKIMTAMGFGEEVKAKNDNICPICRKPIFFEDFTDALSRTEFVISGLCQRCQNNVFDQ